LEYLDLRNNPICKNTNINYAILPIKQANWNDESTWQEQLNTFPSCTSPLIPAIIVSPPGGIAPMKIELDASNSKGSITQYTWTINGQTLSGQITSTTLKNIGEYTLTLTVTDPEGQTATTQQSVFVYKPETVTPQTPVFTVSPPHGMAPLTIELDASDSEGSITQYTWTINGETLSGQTNSTTLTEAGEQTLVLTVTGNDGQTATTQQSVFVWQPGQAIIIAGPNPKDPLFKYSNEFTQRMYRLLKQRGYDDDQIQYLNVLAPDIDPFEGRPEPERQDYNLFDPEKDLSDAFAQAADHLTVGDQFVFYLHGHAGHNRFQLLDEKISAAQLRDLLATLPAGVQQIIILDTCYAGSFMDELAGVPPHRLVVTSTDDKSSTYQVENNSFANEFMHILESGGNVFEAFRRAEDMILNEPKYFLEQRPWLDDNSDGQFLDDGLYAENVRIGLRRIDQAPPPKIKQVHPRITLPENEGTTTLWVNMTDNENLHQVRAILIPPEYEMKAYLGEKTDFSRLELPMQYNAVEENYGVKYEGFCAKAGLWQILYQAQDTSGAWSAIVQGEVQASECLPVTVKMLINQSRYTTGNPLRLNMQVNGQEKVDLYVAIIFPEGYFLTIAYPLAFSLINAIQVYQPAVEIAGQKIYSIMDFPLPAGIPTGGYQACGVLVLPNAEPADFNNWINSHCAEFEVY